MKNFIFITLVISLAACNNSDSKGKQGKDSTSVNTSNPQNSNESSASSGACSNMIVFHKGAVIEGKNYDGEGNETSSQTTTVTDVKDENGLTVAEADITSSITAGKAPMHIRYKCNGKSMFMDINAMLSNFKALSNTKTEASSLEFPVSLSAGEQLPDASLSVSTDRAGMSMNIKTTYKNRKVEAKEPITTPAGTWNCYKITSEIVTDVDMPGADKQKSAIAEMMKKSMPRQKSVIWFAPDFGLVRMEMLSNDKVLLRTDITGYKN